MVEINQGKVVSDIVMNGSPVEPLLSAPKRVKALATPTAALSTR